MAGGKRLDNSRHIKKNNTSQTGKFRLILDNDYTESNIATEDSKNPTINFYYVAQNSNEKSASGERWDKVSREPQNKTTKFNWWQCLAVFLLASIVGVCLYDCVAPVVIRIGGGLATVLTLLPLEKCLPLTWNAKWTESYRPIKLGVILAAAFLFLVCELGGWRLNIVSAKGAPEQSEVTTVQPSEEGGNEENDVENTPTIEPSPSLPSIVADGAIVEPITVTPQPSDTDVVLQNVQADYFELICFENEGQDHTSFTAGEIEKWKAEFLQATRELIGTRKANNARNVNQVRFESLTMEANILEQQLSEQLDQIAALQEIIQLREDACEIRSTQSLCNMLLNNYMSMAKEYTTKGDAENAYQSYYSAAKWALAHIQGIDEVDDNYYQELYYIATAYQRIGSLEGLSDEDKIDANYISLCLFEAVSQNLTSGGNMQYLSCIYAGMVSHNLLNLDAEAAPEDQVGYFEESYAYYKKALETPNKDEKNIYGYLNQICAWAEQYSRTKKGKPFLQDAEVYKELAAEYKEMSR